MRDLNRDWGIPLDYLRGPNLFYVLEEFATDPAKTFSLVEKLAPYQDLIQEEYGWPDDNKVNQTLGWPRRPPQDLEQFSHYLPISPFFDDFTFDELAKYMFSSFVSNNVSKAFQRSDYQDYRTHEYLEIVPPEPAEFVYKLRNSLHHYGDYPSSWNHLVKAYYAIPDYNFGSELMHLGRDFETRFDHTRYFNYWGQAQHISDQILTKSFPTLKEGDTYFTDNTVYLDGIFAYLIFYRGKHVMTISFSLGSNKIFLTQIQLRDKKGNRWAYRLPAQINYFNYVIDSFYQHFVERWGFELYLVEGSSLAKRLAKIHDPTNPLSSEVAARVTTFYNQSLIKYQRQKEYSRQDLKFNLVGRIKNIP